MRLKAKRSLNLTSLPANWTEKLVNQFQTFFANSEGSFAYSYQASEFLQKFNDDKANSNSASVRRHRAIEKFLAAEDRNASTNYRLFWETSPFCGEDPEGECVLVKRARYHMSRILGKREWMKFNLQPTNGASTRVRKGPAAALLKLEGEANITVKALPHWLNTIDGTVLEDVEGLVYPRVVPGSVLFTVPKNAEIDRAAAKEPELNQFLQRSVGLHIRDRLLRVTGIDLTDQSRNRELAARGSKYRDWATIDLSSASDLISRTLVNRLVPPDWYTYLDDIRSHTMLIDGEPHSMEMFSSMGNGFTFELETAIFWSLAKAILDCCDLSQNPHNEVFVYGDDIVCSPALAKRISTIFPWFGFKINKKKSYWSGPFRESCGGHYYNGSDVTPFYLRNPLRELPDLLKILNEFRAWIVRVDPFCLEAKPLWDEWARKVPAALRGGKDLGETMCLVSPHRRRSVLARRVVNEVYYPSESAYHLWLAGTANRRDKRQVGRLLNAAWVNCIDREVGAFEPSFLQLEGRGLYYKRDRRFDGPLEMLFVQEYG